MSGPQIQKRGFRSGLGWLPAGAELLGRHWRPLLGVASLWLLVSLLASLIPVLGQLTLMVLTPLLTAGLLAAFDQSIIGTAVRPVTLFSAWALPDRRATLIGLGLISLSGTFLSAMIFAAWLTSQIDPSTLEAVMNDPEALAQALQGASLGGGIILALLLFLVVLAGLFFAVPLVMFGGVSLLPSLRYSYRACLANPGAMLGLLTAVVGFGIALGFIMLLLVALMNLALGAAGQFISQLIIVAATLFAQVVLTGSQYVAFCDISGWTAGPQAPATDDSLVA
ncbi:MAG: BPSS1780 family membrane protein [Wenzhouxiangella sp.]|jgi:hypothetical protein|nr:BPSS1780 family membrane protein [Wenzhouxiangella sp.]